MTATEYKRVCAQPDVFLRFLLEGTLSLLVRDSEIVTKLKEVLAQEPISKPAFHQESNNQKTDQFRVNLSRAEADEIIKALTLVISGAAKASADSTHHRVFIAHWLALWTDYRQFKTAIVENNSSDTFLKVPERQAGL